MRNWKKILIAGALALVLSVTLPLPAFGAATFTQVAGTETILSIDHFESTVLPNGGSRNYWEFRNSYSTSSPLLTGLSDVAEWAVFGPDGEGMFWGEFTIVLDTGGEWRGRFHGQFTDGIWSAEYQGRGFGGAVDGGLLRMSIANYVVDATILLHD